PAALLVEESVEGMVECDGRSRPGCRTQCNPACHAHGPRGQEEHAEQPEDQGGGDRRQAHAAALTRVKVVLYDAAPEQELGPRGRTQQHVGADDGGGRPLLEVLDLQILEDSDAVAGVGEPVAQVDVLDAWLLVPLVEAARCEECLPPYGPAGGPEGADLVPAPLVDVMVEEVAVL